MANSKQWFTDDDGTVRFLDLESKTLFMPYNIESEDYSETVKGYIKSGFTVQLEIV